MSRCRHGQRRGQRRQQACRRPTAPNSRSVHGESPPRAASDRPQPRPSILYLSLDGFPAFTERKHDEHAGRVPGHTSVIRKLEIRDAPACDAIIASLPEWFGNEAGIDQCAAAVRSQQGLVSEVDGRVVGFVTHVLHAPGAAELTWMAVDADFRRGGHGTALVDALVDGLRRDGVRLLSVKTLSESAGDSCYAQTRA